MLQPNNLRLTLADIFDPRGRADRKGLAVLAAAFIAVQFVASIAAGLTGATIGGAAGLIIHSFAIWIAIAGCAKRLHDLGRSLWSFAAFLALWMLWSFALSFGSVFAFGPDEMMPGGAGFLAVIAGGMLPALAVLLWLHFAEGEQGPNRFGPKPGPTGFTQPHEANRLQRAAPPREVISAATY